MGSTAVGRPIIKSFAELESVDAVIISDIDDPQSGYNKMAAVLPDERILVPPILKILRNQAAEEASS